MEQCGKRNKILILKIQRNSSQDYNNLDKILFRFKLLKTWNSVENETKVNLGDFLHPLSLFFILNLNEVQTNIL